MMEIKKSKKSFPKDAKSRARRGRAVSRLELQLESGKKTTKEGTAELTDSDRTRIGKELATLQGRV